MSVEQQVKSLEKKVEALTRELTEVHDELKIRKLQHAYGYYIDKCLYDEVIDLFSDDCEVRFMHGVYKGKAGARRLYVESFQKRFTGGKNGPIYGFLLDHPMYQDVVTITPDGQMAHARFRCNMQAGTHVNVTPNGQTPRQWWEGALYENVYKKVDGTWRIHVLNYNPVWHANFETGWAYTPPEYVRFADESQLYPKNPLGPDAIDRTQVLWPDHGVLTFHYPHPVTGKKFKPQKPSTAPRGIGVRPSAPSAPPPVTGPAPARQAAPKPVAAAPQSRPQRAPSPEAAKSGDKLVVERAPAKSGAKARA